MILCKACLWKTFDSNWKYTKSMLHVKINRSVIKYTGAHFCRKNTEVKVLFCVLKYKALVLLSAILKPLKQ